MIEKLIKRPIAVTMCAVALVVMGIVASGLLPVSLMPAIDIPQITIKVGAPNISARQLQNTVVVPLWRQLMQTPYLKNIEATSKDGSATIFMQFDYGTDIDYTFIDVNERVDRAMTLLPAGISRPSVVKASASDIPAFFLNLSMVDTTRMEVKMLDLSDFASSVISKRLEQLQQVAFVDISGRQWPQLTIKPDLVKLNALGKDIGVIEQAIASNNIDLGNLTITDEQYIYNIRLSSTINDRKQIENIVVNIDGRLYPLCELATVSVETQPKVETVRSDSRPAITMAIIKQSDARMDDLHSAIKSLTAQMEQEYPELNFQITRDQTELLNYSIGNLEGNLLVGGILACLVIFLFMQDLRTPLLVTVTIPLSFLLSLLLFFIIDVSINIVSLSGLMLGLGMMVDNSIIVIDNISQRWDRGETLTDSVTKGSGEVFSPLLSSVLTTCSIFLPLIFLSGVAGAMFYDQAMAVTIGLMSSLIVAMTVIPVYYYLLYRKADFRAKNSYLQRYGIPEMTRPYEKSLKWVFRHQLLFWIVAGAITLSGFAIIPLLEKRSLPEVERTDLMLNVSWNEPLSIEQNDLRSTKLVKALGAGVVHYTSMVGRNSFALNHTPETSKEESQIYVCVGSADSLALVERLADNFLKEEYPEALLRVSEANNVFDMIFSQGSAELVAQLRPTDGQPARPEGLNPLLEAISKRLPDVYVEPVVWQQHITLYPNRELMQLYNVSEDALYRILRSAMNDNRILQLNHGDKSLSVVLGGKEQTLSEILQTVTVRSDKGVEIPVSIFIDQSDDRDLRSIVSGNQGDYYPLPLNVEPNLVPSTMAAVREVVDMDKGFDVSFVGEWFDGRIMMKELMVVLLVALLLLYFILASQFESLVQPFIILSEIAIDLSGALFVLWICGESLNLMSMIGMIVMSGIVINDSILKVDTFNRLRRSGTRTLRAILTGGERRLKPIIMTSLTTIMAIIPFLFSAGMGNDLQRPLSLVIIGGMIIGTIFSIYGIPLIYYYIYRRR